MRDPQHASEVAFFFGDPSAPNFGVLHAPSVAAAESQAGIVICAPLAHEFDFSHRLLVEFARVLSGAGLWVLRFDYRGHGDSFGTFADYALADYVADIRQAMAALEERAGVPCRGLCGLRLGATLAATVWAEDPRPGPLTLWEPVAQGARYLDDLLRAILAKQMAHERGASTTRELLRQRIANGEPVIFEGRPITPGLVRSLESLDLESVCRRLAKPTLLVQISKRPTTQAAPPLRKLHRDLNTRCQADLQAAVMPLPWFGSLVLDYAGRIYPHALFQQTCAWIGERLREVAPAAEVRGRAAPRRHATPATVGTASTVSPRQLVACRRRTAGGVCR